jgi:starch phosphorylase
VAPSIAQLLARYVDPEWAHLDVDDSRWNGVDDIPDAELWATHEQLRRQLVANANARSNWSTELRTDALTIGFSRRFAHYKRAGLLLRDRDRLEKILDNEARPVQVLYSGKAHPADGMGKHILTEVVWFAREHPRVAFLVDYDMDIAMSMVSGSDVWLNTPRRLVEASGTSGMKAGANGVLNLSISDGWWDEGYRPGTGWIIDSTVTLDEPESDDAEDAEALYRLLEDVVVPLYYERENGIPTGWVRMMRASLRHVITNFSARRMVLDYHDKCYLPAGRRRAELELPTRVAEA